MEMKASEVWIVAKNIYENVNYSWAHFFTLVSEVDQVITEAMLLKDDVMYF